MAVEFESVVTVSAAKQIAESLRAAIMDGRLKVDERLPTEEELAAAGRALEDATGQRQWSHSASSVRRHLAVFPLAGDAADAENSVLFALSLATSSSRLKGFVT